MQITNTIIEFYTKINPNTEIANSFDSVLGTLQTSPLMARQKNQITPLAITVVRRFGKDHIQGRIIVDGMMQFLRWDEVWNGITFREVEDFDPRRSMQCVGFQVDRQNIPHTPPNFGENHNDDHDNENENDGDDDADADGDGDADVNPDPNSNQEKSGRALQPASPNDQQEGTIIFSNQEQHANESRESLENLRKSSILESRTDADTDAETKVNLQKPDALSEANIVKMETEPMQTKRDKSPFRIKSTEVIVVLDEEFEDQEKQEKSHLDANVPPNVQEASNVPILSETIRNAHESQQRNRDSNPFENRVQRISLSESQETPLEASGESSQKTALNEKEQQKDKSSQDLLLRQNLEKISELISETLRVKRSNWEHQKLFEQVLLFSSQLQSINPNKPSEMMTFSAGKDSRVHKVIQKNSQGNKKTKKKARRIP